MQPWWEQEVKAEESQCTDWEGCVFISVCFLYLRDLKEKLSFLFYIIIKSFRSYTLQPQSFFLLSVVSGTAL